MTHTTAPRTARHYAEEFARSTSQEFTYRRLAAAVRTMMAPDEHAGSVLSVEASRFDSLASEMVDDQDDILERALADGFTPEQIKAVTR